MEVSFQNRNKEKHMQQTDTHMTLPRNSTKNFSRNQELFTDLGKSQNFKEPEDTINAQKSQKLISIISQMNPIYSTQPITFQHSFLTCSSLYASFPRCFYPCLTCLIPIHLITKTFLNESTLIIKLFIFLLCPTF